MIRLLSALGVNTFETFAVNKAKQFVACTPDGLRDRRRDPLLPRREHGQPRRAALRPQLGAVPRRDRRLRRDVRPRRAHGREPDRQAQDLPLPGPGPDRDAGAGEGDRRPAPRDQVLQHGRGHDRRPHGARAAPRHVRRPRARAVRPLGRVRGRPRRDRRGRRGLRPRARSARGSTRRTRSSRAGSPARCRRSSPATSSRRTASGCPPRATRAPARSAGASTPTTSPTTT